MTDEERAPWTIKSVRVETRKLATASAMKQGINMAEWLDRAVRHQADLDRGNQVIPPGQPGQFLDAGAGELVPVAPVQLPDKTSKPMDLTGLADALRAVAMVSEAAAMPVSKSLAREASALLRQQIREARGKT